MAALMVAGTMEPVPANFTCQGSSGQAGFDRPNHDLPGWPVHQGSAAACEASCTVDVQCRMWSWSAADQQCWLKNLIGPRTTAPGFCSALAPAPPASAVERFPLGNYTPFGYLQNGYHSAIHYSGILRTDDVLNGLGWFFPIKIPDDQPLGALGAEDYVALLAFSARPAGLELAPVLSNEAFAAAGIERSSDLHTKSRLRVGWETPGILTSVEYWQMGEDMLAAEVTVRSTNSAGPSNTANTAAIDVLLSVGRNAATEVRGSSGGSSELCVDPGGGSVFGLTLIGSSAATNVGGGFFENVSAATVGLHQPSTTITNVSLLGSRGIGAFTFTVPVASSGNSSMLFLMARGASCAAVSTALSDGDLSTPDAMLQHRASLKEDDGRFWKSAARVSGAWPAAWQSGLIYDFNNIRLNLQPAKGIFKDMWDGMQVGYPRVVVAESSMDYLTLSYGNMDLAKRLFFGLFRDAIAVNVPCVHEDGQPNLVCVDGSVGGTPPCWGGPFITALSIYRRSGDKQWLEALYPKMGAYIEFWTTNRSLTGGYSSARCSWEGGADDEPRWGWKQTGGASISSQFRTVEMQTAAAHAAGTMRFFAKELEKPAAEIKKWSAMVELFTHLARTLWNQDNDGWFTDFDTETMARSVYGKWNGQVWGPLFFQDTSLGVDFFASAGAEEGATEPNASALAETIIDPTMFFTDPPGAVPVASDCNHTVPEWGHDRCWSVSGQFRPAHDAIRLDRVWAANPYQFAEGAARVGRHDVASKFVTRLLNTVYAVMDKRTRELHLPLPGVNYEAWDTAMMAPGMPKVSSYLQFEGYGWGSITTVLLLQNVVGFREAHIEAGDHPQAFDLVPQLPLQLFEQCADFNAGHLLEFRVHNLAVRGRIFDLTYEHRCGSAAARIVASGEVPLRVVLHEHERVEGSAGSIVALMTEVLSFDANNGRKCRVEIGVTSAAWKARCAN